MQTDEGIAFSWDISDGKVPPTFRELSAACEALRASKSWQAPLKKEVGEELQHGTWVADYSAAVTVADEIPLMHPVLRRFILGLSSTQKSAIQSWRRDAKTEVSVKDMQDHALSIGTHIESSTETNQQLAALASDDLALDSEADADADGDQTMADSTLQRFLNMFVGDNSIAVPLPGLSYRGHRNGSIVFEGRASWLDEDIKDLSAIGLDTIFRRKRATSSSWMPQIALPWAIGEGTMEDNYNEIVSKGVAQPFLLAHEIVSDDVLAIDVGAVKPESLESEVILRPFLNFHVVGDDMVLLPSAGGIALVRVLRTHVYTESHGMCPKCNGGPGSKPDLAHLINRHSRKIADVAVLRHMRAKLKFETALIAENVAIRSRLRKEDEKGGESQSEDVDAFNPASWDDLGPGRSVDNITRDPGGSARWSIYPLPMTEQTRLCIQKHMSAIIPESWVTDEMALHPTYKHSLPKGVQPRHAKSAEFELERTKHDELTVKIRGILGFFYVPFGIWNAAKTEAVKERMKRTRFPRDGELECVLSCCPSVLVDRVRLDALRDRMEYHSVAGNVHRAVVQWIGTQHELPDDMQHIIRNEFRVIRKSEARLGGWKPVMAMYLLQRRHELYSSFVMDTHQYYAVTPQTIGRYRIAWPGELEFVLQLMTPKELNRTRADVHKLLTTTRTFDYTSKNDGHGFHFSDDPCHDMLMQSEGTSVERFKKSAGILDLIDKEIEERSVYQAFKKTLSVDRDSETLVASYLGRYGRPISPMPTNKRKVQPESDSSQDEDGDALMHDDDASASSAAAARNVRSRLQGRGKLRLVV